RQESEAHGDGDEVALSPGNLQCLPNERQRFLDVARIDLQISQQKQRPGRGLAVADLAAERNRLFQQLPGRWQIAPPLGEKPDERQGERELLLLPESPVQLHRLLEQLGSVV